MNEYVADCHNCAAAISNAVRQRKRIALVIGNGFHYIPLLDNFEVLKFYVAITHHLFPSDTEKELVLLAQTAGTLKRRLREALYAHALDTQVNDIIKTLSGRSREKYIWAYYELWRSITSSKRSLPWTFSSMIYLLNKGLVSALITTNYDLYIDTMIDSSIDPASCRKNPCLEEDEWDSRGYFSKRLERLADKTLFWKIHGDLSYASWECGCKEKLDSNKEPAPIWRREGTSDKYARHYIDFNGFSRKLFQRETSEAILHLSEMSTDTSLIITVGFKGDYNEHTTEGEELAPALLELEAKGVPTFMLVAPSAYIEAGYSYLWDRLKPVGRAIQPPKDSNTVVAATLAYVMSLVPEFSDFPTFTQRWAHRHDDLSKFLESVHPERKT